ncbi:enoyl-CoA hydratase/isomerase family protein [Chelatococcus asaccharovorans]|uniref:enoyl-CoA hydratase/isomerase family protein n=1 Tax=Chelatococcus asaccharovorans TaxID=28210 RepID=UPI00224C6529|nr:enoyl-CoA hydratase-related protein [Chelatococcus asaccharovorans]CAH1663451.1 putative enoyl-CoA hydratase/isomerase YngF [Chelatococcus asaccharovorans]CAH1682792.1 putative enoyl-CoA hydratase/isomerase YngF [Chelatococcus asaccharovorans]
MRAEYETITVARRDDHLLLVTLNRPAVYNAMNTQMGLDLMELFEGFAIAAEDVRAIVLTGSGDKAFCAGGDLKERKGMSDEAWQSQHAIFERMLRAIMGCPIPLIAAVNGIAYGGGCEIAAATDFVYAATTARFALTEVTLGIMPGSGGTQNLARAVGERRAKEIILSGLPFSAEDGERWGLVNKVLAPEELVEGALAIGARIAGNGPIAVRQAKQAIHRGLQMSLWDGLAFEIEAYNRMIPTQDRREGVLAFNERRKPNFQGR